MPLYEYQCPQCGTFERMQKFSDPVLTACPTCASAVEKLLSPPAIQFKGAGWYVTDYAKKALGREKGDEAKDQGGAAKDTGGQAKDGGETKSETARKESSSSSKSGA